MRGNDAGGNSLEWGIKNSLIEYVREMPDGVVSASNRATETDTGFRFAPSQEPTTATELRFSGTVTLTGHGGLLRIIIADPWLEPPSEANTPWHLTIEDPYEPKSRLEFASIRQVNRADGGSLVGSGTELTHAGSELFFAGPYVPGTPLADPVVLEAQ